jgi:DsbC/DsbD-like thiol-disulfide interchange protein
VGTIARALAAGVLISWTSGVAAAEPEWVNARVVTDASHLEPDGALVIGVLLEMAPGWHIYWKNPGDSGLATDVQLGLPPGFAAGPLLWPLPIEFSQPGNLIGYGYEGSVLLASEVRVPDRLPAQPLTVKASVSWLACKDVCVLGSAELEETLPLDGDEVAQTAAAITGWRTNLPEPEPSGDLPFELSTTGGLDPEARGGELSLWLRWPSAPSGVECFPEPGDRLKVSNPKVQTRGSLSRIDVELTRVGSGADAAEYLPSLVVFNDESGARRGVEINVPINN